MRNSKLNSIAASLAAVAMIVSLGTSTALARGGGGHGGGFGGSHFGGTHFGGSRFAGTHFGGRGIGRGYPGRGWGRWAGWHHRWYWRDGRWFYGDYGVDGGVDAAVAPVTTPGPCTCLTKTYTQDGLVVFADVCTKEAASAPVGGTEVTPPAKTSEVTPPPAPPTNVADASKAPTTTNYAGKTYQDFLAANGLAQKN